MLHRFVFPLLLAVSACTPRPSESSTAPAQDGGRRLLEQGIDSLEVAEVGADAQVKITDPGSVQRVLQAMTYSARQPSGGKRRWTIRCYAGPKLVADVFVYPDGEWGYESRTRGVSPELVVALESLR